MYTTNWNPNYGMVKRGQVPPESQAVTLPWAALMPCLLTDCFAEFKIKQRLALLNDVYSRYLRAAIIRPQFRNPVPEPAPEKPLFRK